MTEFSFKVTLSYRDAQAFIKESLERAHDRLTKRVFDALVGEFPSPDAVVEVEPV